jgi:hypothetical protein
MNHARHRHLPAADAGGAVAEGPGRVTIAASIFCNEYPATVLSAASQAKRRFRRMVCSAKSKVQLSQ